jgi:hypothetical protein
MQNTLDRVVKLHNERHVMIRTLELWAHTEKAGYKPEVVQAFSFRPKFLSSDEKKELLRTLGDRSDCDTHYNCVIIDGEPKEIPMIQRPETTI